MEFYNNSIFWIDVDKIKPNPFQPRREFDEVRLKDLAGSIRQYGVLQPLVVTRKEIEKPDVGISVEYELISGERRLRASRLAGLVQVPAIIKTGDQSDRLKLELAIIENLQREDLNPIERAKSFKQLVDQFGLKHIEVAEKIGKSREYVSNSIRLLLLPQEMQDALYDGKISEGHTRPLLMLTDRSEEQGVLFKEIMLKKMTVREAEGIARRIAFERARKKDRMFAPDIIEMEEKLTEVLGTRVLIEQKNEGGKIHIDFFNESDLRSILERIKESFDAKIAERENILNQTAKGVDAVAPNLSSVNVGEATSASVAEEVLSEQIPEALDDRSAEEKKEEEESYDLNNFSV